MVKKNVMETLLWDPNPSHRVLARIHSTQESAKEYLPEMEARFAELLGTDVTWAMEIAPLIVTEQMQQNMHHMLSEGNSTVLQWFKENAQSNDVHRLQDLLNQWIMELVETYGSVHKVPLDDYEYENLIENIATIVTILYKLNTPTPHLPQHMALVKALGDKAGKMPSLNSFLKELWNEFITDTKRRMDRWENVGNSTEIYTAASKMVDDGDAFDFLDGSDLDNILFDEGEEENALHLLEYLAYTDPLFVEKGIINYLTELPESVTDLRQIREHLAVISNLLPASSKKILVRNENFHFRFPEVISALSFSLLEEKAQSFIAEEIFKEDHTELHKFLLSHTDNEAKFISMYILASENNPTTLFYECIRYLGKCGKVMQLLHILIDNEDSPFAESILNALDTIAPQGFENEINNVAEKMLKSKNKTAQKVGVRVGVRTLPKEMLLEAILRLSPPLPEVPDTLQTYVRLKSLVRVLYYAKTELIEEIISANLFPEVE